MDFCPLDAKIEMLRTAPTNLEGKLGCQNDFSGIFLTRGGTAIGHSDN
jgi:hypothetical protein